MAATTTTAKGLGWAHQRNRDRLLALHVDGTRCWWCGRGMYRQASRNPDGKSLHADHTRARSKAASVHEKADRLLHDTCNKQRGDGSRDSRRPALVARLRKLAARKRSETGALVIWPELPAGLIQ